VRQEEKKGIAVALNNGLDACTGDVVFRLDADDIACPSRVRSQLQYLQTHPEVSIVGGAIRTFTETASEGFVLNRMFYPFPVEPGRVRWELLFSCPLAHPAVALRRSLVAEHGPLYPTGVDAEDHACWLRLAARGVQMANVPDIVTFIRRHPDSRSAQHSKDLRASSQKEVAAHLQELCNLQDEDDQPRVEDVAFLWGDALPTSRAEAARATKILERALSGMPSAPICVSRFREEDCRRRKAALACSCLASGDVDAGAALVQGLLAATGNGSTGRVPKSLAELLGAGIVG